MCWGYFVAVVYTYMQKHRPMQRICALGIGAWSHTELETKY